jgi:hypothetical protein
VTLTRWPDLAFGVLVALTILLKIVANPGEPRRLQVLRAEVIAFLGRHEFKTEGADARSAPVVRVSSGDCRLRILESHPWGWNRDAAELYVREHQRVAFVFDGTIYADQPIVRTTLSYVWTFVQWKLGIEAPWQPVLLVAANSDCSIEHLPWTEIATLH